MGRLTEDMTRLRDEITSAHAAAHAALEGFVDNLALSVATMQADFRKAHTMMAKRTKAERAAFVSETKQNVASLQADFRKAHAAMAKHTKAERADFVSETKQNVASLRDGIRNDLDGAHEAWFGSPPPRAKAECGARERRKSSPARVGAKTRKKR